MDDKISSAPQPLSRIFGYDIARTLTLIGMVIISFWELGGEGEDSPAWLNFFVKIIMGRAAVAFVMLAGVGLHLLTQGALMSNDPKRLAESRHQLMKRALFLFIIGILNSLIWPWDILHFYAVYFMITAYLLCASNRLVWTLILLAIFIFADFMLLTQFDRGMEWESIRPQDLWHLSGVFYHLMFGGIYPVFPWIGFLLIGLWIGRRGLIHRGFRNKMILAGIVAVLIAEGLSWAYFNVLATNWRLLKFMGLMPWFTIDPWEPMPLFFLSGAGSAIVAISLCMIFTEKFSTARWLPPLVAAGQSTLTLYVAHTLVGTVAILTMDYFDLDYPLFAVWGTLVYFAAAAVFCYQWNRRYQRGPLELLMRRFMARPVKLTFSGLDPFDFNKHKRGSKGSGFRPLSGSLPESEEYSGHAPCAERPFP
ncbi:MAG: DUF418 domain-containing protein [Desulfobacterales bacterium]|nr:DUF418 domain-containing protein [Desulfobacterales bacterium]